MATTPNARQVDDAIVVTGSAPTAGQLPVATGTGNEMTWTDPDAAVLDNVDSITFDTAAGVSVSEGEIAWNNTDKTLDMGTGSGGVIIQMGQEFLLRARNQSGVTLVDGDVVYITGAQGTRPTIAKTQANLVSADSTIGVVTQTIANNTEGFVTLSGLVRNLNTSTFTEGDTLWLSASVLGGVTNVKPSAPDNAVRVGFVVRQHASAGIIFAGILKEEQLAELHDVSITSLTDGDIISYDSGAQAWVNGNPQSIGIITTDGGQTITGAVFGLNGVSYTWPVADGSNGQALTTNGAGNLTWEFRVSTVSGGDNVTITGGVQSPIVNLDSSQTHATFDLNTTDATGTANTVSAGTNGVIEWDWDGVNTSVSLKQNGSDRVLIDETEIAIHSANLGSAPVNIYNNIFSSADRLLSLTTSTGGSPTAFFTINPDASVTNIAAGYNLLNTSDFRIDVDTTEGAAYKVTNNSGTAEQSWFGATPVPQQSITGSIAGASDVANSVADALIAFGLAVDNRTA